MRSIINQIYMTTGESGDMSSAQGIKLSNSNTNSSNNVFKIDRITGGGVAYSKLKLNMATTTTTLDITATNTNILEFKRENGSEKFKLEADPYNSDFVFSYTNALGSTYSIYTYIYNVLTFNSTIKFGVSSFQNSGGATINIPSIQGTLALIDQVQEKQSYIALGDITSGP
eukprot:COSAG01_NODE_5981_length_3919_cov_4.402094_7_plen_170_part_01